VATTKQNEDSKQVEGLIPLESKVCELGNLGSKEEVEESLQEGPPSGVRFPKILENLASMEVELNFCIKMLELVDAVNQEFN
jgi:hypothetical protein